MHGRLSAPRARPRGSSCGPATRTGKENAPGPPPTAQGPREGRMEFDPPTAWYTMYVHLSSPLPRAVRRAPPAALVVLGARGIAGERPGLARAQSVERDR